MHEPIVIAENTRAEWRKFSDNFDCVPDPMIIRTAELFLNGKSGCSRLGTGAVWQTIERNLHGLLTFFNMLMTRDAIPLIAYYETFHQDESMWPVADNNIVALLERAEKDLIIQVHVEKKPYEEIRNAAWKNLKRLQLRSFSYTEAADVANQLMTYQYDWKPSLGEVQISDNAKPMAHFLLGGLIFGAYSQAGDADHVLQNKRSQLFLGLTKPDVHRDRTRYEREEALFAELKKTCAAEENVVRFDDLPAMPSVLADVLFSRHPHIERTSEILPRVIAIRQSRAGQAYRNWFKQLRSALGDGLYAKAVKREIEEVRREAEHRLNEEYAKWGMNFTPTASAGTSIYVPESLGISVKASAEMKLAGEKLRLAIPDWIRNMIVDYLPFGRHRKLLLRSALAQAEFQDMPERLRGIWEAS